jgi:2-haloacid dehalogenase
MRTEYDAVAFDLLTALVDSWTLFASVTGDEARGRDWRVASLRLVTGAGRYRDYESILRDAAVEAKLPPSLTDTLVARWGELEPWPEVPGRPGRPAARPARSRRAGYVSR